MWKFEFPAAAITTMPSSTASCASATTEVMSLGIPNLNAPIPKSCSTPAIVQPLGPGLPELYVTPP